MKNIKIEKEIALSILLLAAMGAIFLIWDTQQRQIQQLRLLQTSGSVDANSQIEKAVLKNSKPKVVQGTLSFRAYGLEQMISVKSGIVGNDYRDGLIQFVIAERTNKDKLIAYDGGLPLVGIRISQPCSQKDITGLCDQIYSINKNFSQGWIVRKNEADEIVSEKRKSLFSKGDDYFDNYYLKKGDRVISVYYEHSLNSEVYVLEGEDKKSLPKLPSELEEEKRMKAFMQDLVDQLESSL